MNLRDGAAGLFGAAMLTTPALASGGEGGWSTIAFHAVNLAILVALVVKFGKAPYMRFLASRADDVSQEIDEAARIHDEAKARLDEFEAKLANLEARKAELLEEMRREGEAERDRLVAEGRAEAERIRVEAERSAENEATRARARLQAELVDRAIDVAMGMLAETITPPDRRRLTAEYLTRLEESARG